MRSRIQTRRTNGSDEKSLPYVPPACLQEDSSYVKNPYNFLLILRNKLLLAYPDILILLFCIVIVILNEQYGK